MTPTALIVTLAIDPAAHRRFTALRRAHFPLHRNHLEAHVTLFHALPIGSRESVLADVVDLAGTTAPFDMTVDRVLFLGAGVAFGIASPEGAELRRALARRWDPLLGRQDRAWHGRLHITVQNKVDAATARALHAELACDFVPETIGATGVSVWGYLGGPWQHEESFHFHGPNGAEGCAPP